MTEEKVVKKEDVERNFDLSTVEGRRNYEEDLNKRKGLYIVYQLLVDEEGKFDAKLRKYKY